MPFFGIFRSRILKLALVKLVLFGQLKDLHVSLNFAGFFAHCVRQSRGLGQVG